MPTTEEYMDALRNADAAAAAGDKAAAADAQRLADIISSRQAITPKMGAGEDIVRSSGAGLKQGTEDIVGGSEDTGSALGRTAGRVMKWMGANPQEIEASNAAMGHIASSALNPMGGASKMLKMAGGPDLTSYFAPDTSKVKQTAETLLPALKSLNHDPQTTAGEYAKTGFRFVPQALFGKPDPRGLLMRGGEQLLSGLGSEAAGQATEGTSMEPYARFLGGAGTGALLSSSLLRKGPVSEAAQKQMDKGNVVTAGQATRNPTLMKFESQLGGGTTKSLLDNQSAHYTTQAMQEIGAPAGMLATPDNMLNQHKRIQSDLNRIEQSIGRVPYSPQNQQEMMVARDVYNGNVGPTNRAPIVQNTLDDIGAMMRQNGGPALTGPQLANIRTKIREQMDSADTQTVGALTKIQRILDTGTDIHVANNHPELSGQWQTARSQYRKYLDLEAAVANAPMEAFSKGEITPTSLRGGVKTVEGNRRLVQGKSEFTDLAAEGQQAFPKMPDSGTPGGMQALATAASLASGNIPAAAASLLGPTGMGKALMSAPVQKMLMSTGNNARAALTALYSAYQAQNDRGGSRR